MNEEPTTLSGERVYGPQTLDNAVASRDVLLTLTVRTKAAHAQYAAGALRSATETLRPLAQGIEYAEELA